MNEQSKSMACEKQGGTGMTELLFRPATLGGAVVVGAISEPKLPRLVGE